MKERLSCPDCMNYTPSPWFTNQGICVIWKDEKTGAGNATRSVVESIEFVDDEMSIDEMDCHFFERM